LVGGCAGLATTAISEKGPSTKNSRQNRGGGSTPAPQRIESIEPEGFYPTDSEETPSPTGFPEKQEDMVSVDRSVKLEFRDRDTELFDALEDWARYERRTLSDQILFALDDLVKTRLMAAG